MDRPLAYTWHVLWLALCGCMCSRTPALYMKCSTRHAGRWQEGREGVWSPAGGEASCQVVGHPAPWAHLLAPACPTRLASRAVIQANAVRACTCSICLCHNFMCLHATIENAACQVLSNRQPVIMYSCMERLQSMMYFQSHTDDITH